MRSFHFLCYKSNLINFKFLSFILSAIVSPIISLASSNILSGLLRFVSFVVVLCMIQLIKHPHFIPSFFEFLYRLSRSHKFGYLVCSKAFIIYFFNRQNFHSEHFVHGELCRHVPFAHGRFS